LEDIISFHTTFLDFYIIFRIFKCVRLYAANIGSCDHDFIKQTSTQEFAMLHTAINKLLTLGCAENNYGQQSN